MKEDSIEFIKELRKSTEEIRDRLRNDDKISDKQKKIDQAKRLEDLKSKVKPQGFSFRRMKNIEFSE